MPLISPLMPVPPFNSTTRVYTCGSMVVIHGDCYIYKFTCRFLWKFAITGCLWKGPALTVWVNMFVSGIGSSKLSQKKGRKWLLLSSSLSL